MVILISIIIAIKSTSRKIEILYFSEMNINKEDPNISFIGKMTLQFVTRIIFFFDINES